MFKNIFAATALSLISYNSFAADLPSRVGAPAPVPVFAAAPVSWTGFYVGMNAGYGGDKFEYPFGGAFEQTPYSGKPSVTSGGFLGGAQVGYNLQLANRIVLGVEADYQWSNIEGKVDINGAIAGVGQADINAGSELKYFGTVRARLGYGWDRTLLYVTGGWAFGSVKTGGALSICSETSECFVGGLSEKSNLNSGWTVGAGIEYAIANNVSFKTEYLYVNLGSDTLYSQNYGPGTTAKLDVDSNFHVVRAGLNYRFGGSAAPVVARY
jgi:outer membrane immunogenic protein